MGGDVSAAMTQIVPGLYQSGWPVPAGELAGIRCVVDLAGAQQDAPGTTYVLVQRPIPDGVAPPGDWLLETVRVVIEAMGHGNVLVHCGAGISRSSLVTIATIMALTGMGREQAAEVVRRARPWANPCQPMWEMLGEVGEMLPAARARAHVGRIGG
jgi:hypothetical protein